jgi:hypothetical protein
MEPRYRFALYQQLYEKLPIIRQKAEAEKKRLGLDKLNDEIGLYPGSSSCPGLLPSYVLEPVVASNKGRIQPVRAYQEELRYLIKEIYGDEYEGIALNTCESVLRIVNEVLFAPPTMRKGEAYRGRVIVPLNEDFEYLGGYGRPFPPKYRALNSDRSVAAGELAVEGKSLVNLDTLYAKYAGARYEVHGIKANLVPMLGKLDVEKSVERFARLADRHGAYLTGFQGVGYDTPGYGHHEKNAAGAPRMLHETSKLAHQFDLPHFIDCGGGLPVIGYSPADVEADLMSWSMDKSGRTLACGLLVGREEEMLPIRKAAGVAGQRFGDTVSHGKALFSFADPGRDALVSLIAYLHVLKDKPALVTDPIDRFHAILESALSEFKYARFRDRIRLTKSYCWGGSELNYEATWDGEGFGIPISTLDDFFSDTNPIVIANEAMGVAPATIYSGNMFITPGLGTLDLDGALIEERAWLGAKALVRSIEIVCEAAGLGD